PSIGPFAASPLGTAVRAGKLDAVRALHARGADFKTDIGILHNAVARGDRPMVGFLLAKGIEVDAVLPNGFQFFYPAAGSRMLVIRFFVEKDRKKWPKGAGGVYVRELNGEEPVAILGGTALQVAVAKEQRELVELLLKNKASPNVRFPDGSTLLHLAAALGDVDVLRLLLAHGADL